VASSALRYDREKFWLRAEYQHADGSNGGSGITERKGYGYNLTLAYRLTKKLELLFRFDDFDKDKSISNNNTREYTTGLNWYILGQTARMMLNYVFCENEAKENSHRLILGTQLIL
jgi:phosphate-selective porin